MIPDAGLIAIVAGGAGVVLNLLWPLFRNRTTMLILQAVSTVAFGMHYGLIGANTAAVLLVVATAQALLAIPLGERPAFRLIYLLTIPVIAIIMALSWQGWASAMSAGGFALISIGRYQTRVIPFRILLILALPFWVAHNLIVWSIPGLFSDAVSVASGLWGLRLAIRDERGQPPDVPGQS